MGSTKPARNAVLHRDRIRLLWQNEPLKLVLVICPKCGDEFFADLESSGDPSELDDESCEALTRLERECPDHAHRFVVWT